MKKLIPSLAVIIISLFGFAFSQTDQDDEPKDISINLSTHFDYAFMECFPDDRWMKMLGNAPAKKEDWEPALLTDKDFNSLHVADLISYFNYLEAYSQNCAIDDMEYIYRLEIPKYLSDHGDESTNSERQREALKLHRDSVLILIGNCGREHKGYSDLMKRIIIAADGYELIPDLIKIYQSHEFKEPTYLAVLISLMMNGECKAFEKSSLYKQFDNGLWSLPYTEKTEAEIIQLAKAYYSERNKK